MDEKPKATDGETPAYLASVRDRVEADRRAAQAKVPSILDAARRATSPAEQVQKPNRRWFAFRLRTMLVVVAVLALPLGWVTYSLEWIRQRRDFLANETHNNARWAADQAAIHQLASLPPLHADAPLRLSVFGERGEGVVWVKSLSKCDIARRLFPEARIETIHAGD
jgi:hypothetical protein